MELIYNKLLFRNLLILIIIMLASQFNYYLISFRLKYMSGNIYYNQILSSTCNVFFYIISYQIFSKVGFKKSYFIGFVIAMLGSILLIFINILFIYRIFWVSYQICYYKVLNLAFYATTSIMIVQVYLINCLTLLTYPIIFFHNWRFYLIYLVLLIISLFRIFSLIKIYFFM